MIKMIKKAKSKKFKMKINFQNEKKFKMKKKKLDRIDLFLRIDAIKNGIMH